MRKDIRVTLAAPLFGVGLMAAVAAPALAQPALPYPPPPAPQAEAVPAAPGSQYVWEPGHWHWNGVRYVWMHGRYVIRAAGWSAYVPGAWHWNGVRWVWIPAHWR